MQPPAKANGVGYPLQGVSSLKDGGVWCLSDDALLALGLLKWGQNHAAIAADLLPGYTPSQVAQRVLERTHRQRPANVVKVQPGCRRRDTCALLTTASNHSSMLSVVAHSTSAFHCVWHL